MNEARTQLILMLISSIPYALISWGYAKVADGGWSAFWSALGVLVLVRLLFGIIETIGGVLAWRLYGKQQTIDKYLQILQANHFPKRQYAHDNLSAYLYRIEEGQEYSDVVKTAAKQMEFVLEFCETLGILFGMRMHSAAEAALDIHSPRSEAPVYGASAA